MKNIDSQGLVADLCVRMLISLSPDTLSVDERTQFSFVIFKKAITSYVKGQLRSRKTNTILCLDPGILNRWWRGWRKRGGIQTPVCLSSLASSRVGLWKDGHRAAGRVNGTCILPSIWVISGTQRKVCFMYTLSGAWDTNWEEFSSCCLKVTFNQH